MSPLNVYVKSPGLNKKIRKTTWPLYRISGSTFKLLCQDDREVRYALCNKQCKQCHIRPRQPHKSFQFGGWRTFFSAANRDAWPSVSIETRGRQLKFCSDFTRLSAGVHVDFANECANEPWSSLKEMYIEE